MYISPFTVFYPYYPLCYARTSYTCISKYHTSKSRYLVIILQRYMQIMSILLFWKMPILYTFPIRVNRNVLHQLCCISIPFKGSAAVRMDVEHRCQFWKQLIFPFYRNKIFKIWNIHEKSLRTKCWRQYLDLEWMKYKGPSKKLYLVIHKSLTKRRPWILLLKIRS